MLAASAASGVRSWLGASGFRWLTPQRLRIATVALAALAVIGGSLRFSGSTPPPKPADPAVHAGHPGT